MKKKLRLRIIFVKTREINNVFVFVFVFEVYYVKQKW